MKRVLMAIALLPLFGCDSDPKTVARPARELGQELFSDPALSTSSINRFSCATCHARSAEDPARRLPAFPMAGSAHRPTWWNGYEDQLLEAVNFCVIYFMRGEPLQAGDPYGDALYEYLLSISPEEPAPSIPFTIVKNIQTPPAGDPVRGAELYSAACRSCHGAKGSGSGRLAAYVTVLNDDLTTYYDEAFPGIDHRLIVAEKIRHGQFFGVGGNMPFFPVERLSDEEMADIIDYLDL